MSASSMIIQKLASNNLKPRSEMISHEKSTVPHLVKKFSILHGTRRSISGSTKAQCGMPILRGFKAGHDLKPYFRAVQFAVQWSQEFRQLVSTRPARIFVRSQEYVQAASSSLKAGVNNFKSGNFTKIKFCFIYQHVSHDI
jgi:hypothetical protein